MRDEDGADDLPKNMRRISLCSLAGKLQASEGSFLQDILLIFRWHVLGEQPDDASKESTSIDGND